MDNPYFIFPAFRLASEAIACLPARSGVFLFTFPVFREGGEGLTLGIILLLQEFRIKVVNRLMLHVY